MSSIFAFVFTYISLSISRSLIHALQLQSYRNHAKEISGSFKDPVRVDLAVLKKIVNFWRFQNGSMNLLGNRGKLVSYFLNNAAKACLYELEISENIEIGHFFQSRTFFYLSSNLHTSCLSAFKCYVIKQCRKKFFIVRNTIILQVPILDCSEAAVHGLFIFENLSRKYRW